MLEDAPGAAVPPAVLRFAHDVRDRLLGALPEPSHLLGVLLHGSAVLGDWHPHRSDVDLLVVLGGTRNLTTDEATARVLRDAATRSPGSGLECSVVSPDAAGRPERPWPFLLHVATDGARVRTVDGAGHPGDPDLALHYAVVRAHGLAVHGPAPHELVGAVDRALLLERLDAELGWAERHAAEDYLVLTALRALGYATTGRFVSKTDAGRRALAGRTAPTASAVPTASAAPADLVPRALVDYALRVRSAREDPRPPSPDAVAFAAAVRTRLRSAAPRPATGAAARTRAPRGPARSS